MFMVSFHVVSDREGGYHVHEVAPPAHVGEPLVLAHYHEFHYESTEVVGE